jgi:predicted  nucleic acid-binding Zn-ribbon protein
MRQIPFQTKMEVLDLYLQGLSGDKISEKTGVSKGAVVSIIKDAREGRYPQLELKGRIDELHSLAVRLRKENLDLVQARLGFSFLQRLLNMGIEPERLEEWIEFCSEISPTPPDGFILAAMELRQVEKETGLSYDELASQVKKLADKRQQLGDAIRDLEAKGKGHSELKAEIERNEKRASELRVQRDKLEGEVSFLNSFIEKRAEALGIPQSELEAKLRELVNLDREIADKRSERNRLQGEIEALSERHQKLSSQMEKASADFEWDIKLMRETRQELTEIAEMKGRYEAEVKDMAWAKEILPFLHYPDKVDDPELKLASVVIGCIDKWLPMQKLGFPWEMKWGDITRHVQSKRAQLR